MTKRKISVATNEKPQSVVDSVLRPSAEMHILIGGPYTLNGEEHRYGHTALRVKTTVKDFTYDFGRYGRTTGDLGAEGEGILRVWSSFAQYIAIENALGRVTTDFVYAVFDHQAEAVYQHYNEIILGSKPRPDLERGRRALKVHQLPTNYHALSYNCTTLSLDGANAAYRNFEIGGAAFIRPESVLTFTERIAMKTVGGGTPNRLFLPANLQEYLSTSPAVKVNKIERHGGTQ